MFGVACRHTRNAARHPNRASEISDAASDMPAPKPVMPPATVFGMRTVTIATASGTIGAGGDVEVAGGP